MNHTRTRRVQSAMGRAVSLTVSRIDFAFRADTAIACVPSLSITTAVVHIFFCTYAFGLLRLAFDTPVSSFLR